MTNNKMYNIAIKEALKRIKNTNMRVDIRTKMNTLAFIDHIIFVAENPKDLFQMLNILIEKIEKVGC